MKIKNIDARVKSFLELATYPNKNKLAVNLLNFILSAVDCLRLNNIDSYYLTNLNIECLKEIEINSFELYSGCQGKARVDMYFHYVNLDLQFAKVFKACFTYGNITINCDIEIQATSRPIKSGKIRKYKKKIKKIEAKPTNKVVIY